MKPITPAIQEKISSQVKDIYIANSLQSLSDQRRNEVLYDFHFAENADFPNIIFVLCHKDIYAGRSFADKKWGIYAFDRKTGD